MRYLKFNEAKYMAEFKQWMWHTWKIYHIRLRFDFWGTFVHFGVGMVFEIITGKALGFWVMSRK